MKVEPRPQKQICLLRATFLIEKEIIKNMGQYLNYFRMGKDYLRITQKEDIIKERWMDLITYNWRCIFLSWACLSNPTAILNPYFSGLSHRLWKSRYLLSQLPIWTMDRMNMWLSYCQGDIRTVSGKAFTLLHKGTESSGISVPLASCLECVLWCLLLYQPS